MFFTRVSRLAAILAFAFGVLELLVGFGTATGYLAETALARLAPGVSSSGQVIDRGIYKILLAGALGTLAEIAYSVRDYR